MKTHWIDLLVCIHTQIDVCINCNSFVSYRQHENAAVARILQEGEVDTGVQMCTDPPFETNHAMHNLWGCCGPFFQNDFKGDWQPEDLPVTFEAECLGQTFGVAIVSVENKKITGLTVEHLDGISGILGVSVEVNRKYIRCANQVLCGKPDVIPVPEGAK